MTCPHLSAGFLCSLPKGHAGEHYCTRTMKEQMADAELALIRAEVETLNVHELRAAVVLQRRAIDELRGEANTLAGIMRDAYKVLLTVDGENDDEEQMLIDLRTQMVYALDPYKREGTLL